MEGDEEGAEVGLGLDELGKDWERTWESRVKKRQTRS